MVMVETNMGESCNEYHDILTSDEEKSLHDLNQCKSTTLVKNGMSKDQILSKEFSSHEKAHEFYKEYAKNMGFGSSTLATRRSKTYGYFIDAKFACTKYGKKRPSTAENPRPCLKCDCKALLHVKRRADGIWDVHDFIEEHNHDLIPDFSLHFPCHRSLSTADKITIDHLHSLSIPPSKIHATLTSNYGGVENVNCDEKNIRNYIDKQRRITMQFGDANLMLELFASLQEEDPNFFYAIDLDENQRLKSVFWVHGKGREDYKLFKDVVVFDTTYITNKYKMPFAPFVGVNNHFQTTFLGCALLTDESMETFVWLMKTWLRAMNGEAPNAILTDQCKAMKPAILKVFPNARHRFCLWHIMRKIPEKLSHVIKEHEQFMGVFKGCIYRTWTEMDFEKSWKNMIDKFELGEDEWLRSLYDDRNQWVPTFMRDMFFAGMSTTHRSESINSFFDKYVHRKTSLKEFVEKYKQVVDDRFNAERKANAKYSQLEPVFKTASPFERQLSNVYTHEIFKKFQDEILGAFGCYPTKEKEHEHKVMFKV